MMPSPFHTYTHVHDHLNWTHFNVITNRSLRSRSRPAAPLDRAQRAALANLSTPNAHFIICQCWWQRSAVRVTRFPLIPMRMITLGSFQPDVSHCQSLGLTASSFCARLLRFTTRCWLWTALNPAARRMPDEEAARRGVGVGGGGEEKAAGTRSPTDFCSFLMTVGRLSEADSQIDDWGNVAPSLMC